MGTITLTAAARNAAADAVVSKLDGGTIQLRTSTDVEVATLGLAADAFGAPVDGVATAGAITSDASATGGTVAKAAFIDSLGAIIFTVDVTATGGGGSIELSSTSIAAGDAVSLSSVTYTQPAS